MFDAVSMSRLILGDAHLHGSTQVRRVIRVAVAIHRVEITDASVSVRLTL